MNGRALFDILDLAGSVVFAVSGAAAARQRNLDLFGIIAVAFIAACGGGIVRDLCIGAVPPAALSHWRYLIAAIVAALITIGAYSSVKRLRHPVLLFDAVGLGLFAVTGAHKALVFGHNTEVAILLGMITGVGGGMMRDVLLNRVSIVLEKEIYASAALVGATIEVAGERLGWSFEWSSWCGILTCVGLRYLSLRYHWNLPTFGYGKAEKKDGRE
jgi:uncharacterized membrane protein YeiH